MLKLISCELAKLKRKKFIPFVILSAFLFPLPLALMMLTPRMMERYDTKAELFDDFYQFVLAMGWSCFCPASIHSVSSPPCCSLWNGTTTPVKNLRPSGDRPPDDFAKIISVPVRADLLPVHSRLTIACGA